MRYNRKSLVPSYKRRTDDRQNNIVLFFLTQKKNNTKNSTVNMHGRKYNTIIHWAILRKKVYLLLHRDGKRKSRATQGGGEGFIWWFTKTLPFPASYSKYWRRRQISPPFFLYFLFFLNGNISFYCSYITYLIIYYYRFYRFSVQSVFVIYFIILLENSSVNVIVV